MKTLAFIIDNEIVEILQYDERMASIFLSNPLIVDITKYSISKDWEFDGKEFKNIVDGQEVSYPVENN